MLCVSFLLLALTYLQLIPWLLRLSSQNAAMFPNMAEPNKCTPTSETQGLWTWFCERSRSPVGRGRDSPLAVPFNCKDKREGVVKKTLNVLADPEDTGDLLGRCPKLTCVRS